MATRNRLILNHTGFMPPMRRALTEMGVVIDEENWRPGSDELGSVLGCHVWFYDVVRKPWRIYRLARILRRHRIPLIAWNRDAPHYLNFDIPRRRWMLDLADRLRLLDIYATHTLADRRQFADRVLYLPNAADVSAYNLNGPQEQVFERLRRPETYRYDVSFFGGMNGRRYKEDAAREDFFRELGRRLDAKGITHRFQEASGLSVGQQIELVQSSRINLNFGARCEYRASLASGLPERCYGIPACGGFLLCDRRTHARDDFAIGTDWAEFEGLEDCVSQIDYWLSNFDAARQIAERCYRKVMSQHTYERRAELYLAALKQWHADKGGPLQ
jgi:spore maturation protein CgeB